MYIHQYEIPYYYYYLLFIPVMSKLKFQQPLPQSSVSRDLSEIILIYAGLVLKKPFLFKIILIFFNVLLIF